MIPTISLLGSDSKQALVDIIRHYNREIFPDSRFNKDTINFTNITVLTGKRTRVTVVPNLHAPGYERTAVNSVNFTYNRLDLGEVFGAYAVNDWVIEKPITTEKILAKLKEHLAFKHSVDEFVAKTVYDNEDVFLLEASPTSLRWYGSVAIHFTPANGLGTLLSVRYLLGLVNRQFISPINGYINKIFLKGLEYLDIPNSIEGSITKHVLKGLKNRVLAPGVNDPVRQTMLKGIPVETLKTPITTILHNDILPGHVVFENGMVTVVSDTSNDGEAELKQLVMDAMLVPSGDFTIDNISSVSAQWPARGAADIIATEEGSLSGETRVYFERVNIRDLAGVNYPILLSQMGDLDASLAELNSILNTSLTQKSFQSITAENWLYNVSETDPMFYGSLAIINASPWDFTPVLHNMIYANDDYAVFSGVEGYTQGPQSIGQPVNPLNLANWVVRVENQNEIHAGKVGEEPVLVYTHTDPVDHVSMSFDQNGSRLITFTSEGSVFLRWYDPIQLDTVVVQLSVGKTPYIAPTTWNTILHTSEVVLVYINGTNLVYRRQLDRYSTEYSLGVNNAVHVLSMGHDIYGSLVVVYLNDLGEAREIYTSPAGHWSSDSFSTSAHAGSIIDLTVTEAVASIGDTDSMPGTTYAGLVNSMELQDVVLHTAAEEDTQTTSSYVGSVVSMDMLEARVDINIVEENPAEMLIADPVVTELTATTAQARVEHSALEETPSEMLISDMTISAMSGTLITTAPSVTSAVVSENYITLYFDKYIRTPSNTDGWSAVINGVTPITLVFDSADTTLSSVSGYIRFTYVEPITNTDVLTMSYDSVLGGVYLLPDITDMVINNVVGQGVPARYLTTDNHSGLVLTENDTVATYPNSNTHVRANVEGAVYSRKWFIEYEVLVAERPTIMVSHSYPSVQSGVTLTYTATDGMSVYMPASGSDWRRYYLTEGGSVTYDNLVSQPPLVAGDRITVGYDVDLREMTLCVNGNVVGTWTQSSTVSAGPAHMAVALIQGDSLRISDVPLFPIPGYRKWEGLPTVDPYWDKVVALLRFDGDFTDETGRIWTVVGSPTFVDDGEHQQAILSQTNYIHSDILLGDEPFTLEFFSAMTSNTSSGYQQPIIQWGTSSNATDGFSIEYRSGQYAGISYRTSYSYLPTISPSSGWTLANDFERNHIAVVYDGISVVCYVNGVGVPVENPKNMGTTRRLSLGWGSGSWYQTRNKIIDELRITKGVARYTADFTPPSAPYPGIHLDDIITVLYSAAERGAWYDVSDITTLFQDVDGLIPVTADGQSVALVLDKSGNDRHLRQSALGDMPIYRTDGTKHWLHFNGTTMFMNGFVLETSVTANGSGAFIAAAFTPETDNVLGGVIVESPTPPSHNRVVIYSDTRSSPMRALNFAPDGTDRFSNLSTKTAVNETCIISLNHNGVTGVVKKNNTVLDAALPTSATHAANTCFSIGRQYVASSGGLLYFHGRFYGAVVVGRQLTNTESYSVDRYLAKKSGITL